MSKLLKFYRNGLLAGARAFPREQRGSVAIMFSLAAVPMLLMVGSAVDYGNALRVKSKMQSAADSGVIAGVTTKAIDCNLIANADGTNCGDGQVKKAVELSVKASLSKAVDGTPTVNTTIAKDGTVTTVVTAAQSFSFMKVAGLSSGNITVTSQAMRGGGKMEVALVLDTTGSMAGAKMTALKTAATSLTDTLFAVPEAATRIKIGVVPFAQYVNVGIANKGAGWLTSTDDVTYPPSCWNEYPNATYSNPYTVSQTCYNDGAPYDCSYTAYASVNYGTPVQVCSSYTAKWYGCVGSRNYPADLSVEVLPSNRVPALLDTWCSNDLTRLTNNSATVKAAIDALNPSGETYIAPGVLWGWRVLSPKAPFSDGGTPGTDLQKIMILMTDGANTLSPDYPSHWATNVATANTLTADTCAKAKADGVSIYTIAFSVTDATIKNILQNCASGLPYYYDASTVSDLSAAFANIGAKLTAVRISK